MLSRMRKRKKENIEESWTNVKHLTEKKREYKQKKMEIITADREYLKVKMEAVAICHKNDLENIEEKQEKLAFRDYHKKQNELKGAEEEQEEYNRKFN